MSNTLSPISAAALIHDQHGVDFPCPLPCNDCSCETIWAWIDPCLMTCATILAVIAIATAFFQAAFQTAFLLFPVVAITCYFACQLCLTGEEGRLERAAENLEATVGALEQPDKDLREASAQVTASVATATKDVQTLQAINKDLTTTANTFTKGAGEKGAADAALASSNQLLQQENTQLRLTQTQLQQDLQALAKLVDQFSTQAQFGQAIKSLDDQKAGLAAQNAKLAQGVAAADQTMGQTIKALTEKMRLADEAAKRTADFNAQKQQALEATIARLQATDKGLAKDSAQVSQSVGQLQNVEVQYSAKEQQLKQLTEQFEKTKAQFEKDVASLAQQKETLHSILAKGQAELLQTTEKLTQEKQKLVDAEGRLAKAFAEALQAKQSELSALQAKITEKTQALTELQQKIHAAGAPAKKA